MRTQSLLVGLIALFGSACATQIGHLSPRQRAQLCVRPPQTSVTEGSEAGGSLMGLYARCAASQPQLAPSIGDAGPATLTVSTRVSLGPDGAIEKVHGVRALVASSVRERVEQCFHDALPGLPISEGAGESVRLTLDFTFRQGRTSVAIDGCPQAEAPVAALDQARFY